MSKRSPDTHAFLNAFRAAAALWVLIAHCMIWGGAHLFPLPNPKIAVDLFMLLSGYLMVMQSVKRAAVEPLAIARNRHRFWVRRFFRLAPAYYVSLIVVVAVGKLFLAGYRELYLLHPQLSKIEAYDPANIEYTIENMAWHVTFLFGLHPHWSFSTFLPDWSLSLEMQFYLAFPLLFLLWGRVGPVAGAAIGVALAYGARTWLVAEQAFPEPSFLGFKLAYFMAGMLVCHAVEDPRRPLVWRLLLILLAVIIVPLDASYGPYDKYLGRLLVVSLAIAAAASMAQKLPVLLQRVANSRAVAFASDTSYGVYLFHGVFISLSGLIIGILPDLKDASAPFRTVAILLFVIPSSYVIGYVVHRWIELPGIAFGKTWMDKHLPSRPVPALADPVKT